MMKSILYTYVLSIFFTVQLLAQSTDKVAGCLPLTITFDAPTSSAYFWDFGDSTTSILQAPQHIYTDPGSFLVRLYTDASRSVLVGEISIDVFPDMIINLSSNKVTGCNPDNILFNNEIIKSDNIIVSDLLWTFGDGRSSADSLPVHTYTAIGTYDVSLQVNTNYGDCNKTVINEDMITIEQPQAIFDLDKNASCETPAVFSIENKSEFKSSSNYLWDFGNGEVSDIYNPEDISYNERGTYAIKLTIVSDNGCTDTQISHVSVGGPLVDFDIIDTTCLDIPIVVSNDSQGAVHHWDFGDGASPKESATSAPIFRYKTPGLKTISYSLSSGDCTIDTSFTILVPEKISSFSVSQGAVCDNPGVLQLHADYPGIGSYYWNNSITKDSDSISYEFVNPPRDTSYIQEKQIIELSLLVRTNFGCRDTSNVDFELQLPEAFFIPDSIIGLAPLTIGFSDHSESSDSIVGRHWYFDDGTDISLGGLDTVVTHTFEKPGRYYVKLAIENNSGCIDWSKGTWIEAIEFKQDDTGGDDDTEDGQCDGLNNIDPSNFCIGNSFSWSVNGRAAMDFHVNTEEGRFDHCWKIRSGRYTGKFPGVYPISVDREYKGFLIDRINLTTPLIIPGARAEIGYEKNCSDIYEVSLESHSLNYSRIVWTYNNQVISQDEKFDFRFSEKGVHKIFLEAYGNDGICNPHIDSVSIHVTEPIAVINIEEKLCDNVDYALDASASSDVYLSCGNNILWEFESQRPRAVNQDIVQHLFRTGRQKLSLTVTDINGCTNTVTKDIHVYGNELSFVLDSTICFPNDALLLNTSITDTTVVAWSWNIGSNEKSPTYTFTEQDLHSHKKDTLEVILSVTDALGCVDTFTQYSTRYIPSSHITLDSDEICVGSDLNVRARDYTSAGSYLNFEWDFGEAGIGLDKEETVQYLTKGKHTISLYYEEEGSGCNGSISKQIEVFNRPIADFSSSVDSLDVICYPHIIAFSNDSYTDGPVEYAWKFGDSGTSDLKNPAITYDKGIYNTVLTVHSEYGCSDQTEVSYELVGPSGHVAVSDNTLCVGQDVVLELLQADDVTEYHWDFGDGQVIIDQNPVTYEYTSPPGNGSIIIDLVIKSSDTGCEAIKSIPIRIQNVSADFASSVDSLEHICFPHQIFFDNLSEANSTMTYYWDFGDGTSSASPHPTKTYGKGFYDVEMIARTSFGCVDTTHKSFDIVGPSATLTIDDQEICLGESIQLDISDEDAIGFYSWDFGDGTIVENQSSVNHTYTEIDNDGTMEVILYLESDSTGCTTNISTQINIHEIYANFSQVEGRDYCFGIVELENNSYGADNYIWNLGNGDSSTDEHLLYTYDSIQTYPIMLIASHEATGCSDSIIVEIEPTTGDHFFDFPNVFSPNGDGINDEFNIYVKPIYEHAVQVTNMEIYNRWGKVVYSGHDQNGWDGTLNGSHIEPDVFAYNIEISIKDCKSLQKRGNVTLIR